MCKEGALYSEKVSKLGRVLITGSHGRVGSAIIPVIKEAFDVIELDRNILDADSENFFSTDISDLDELDGIFQRTEPIDFVIHLAADPREDAPWEEVLKNNIIGTRNVYECALRHEVKKVIFASSTHLVGGYEGYPQSSPFERPVEVGDPLRPDGYYGVSKGFGELLAKYYHDFFGIESICIRIGALSANDKSVNPYEKLWLSHRDAANVFMQALKSSISFGIYFATSENNGGIYNIETTKQDLGYSPLDVITKA